MTNWTMVGSHIKKCVAREISERFGIPMKDALEKYVMETRYGKKETNLA